MYGNEPFGQKTTAPIISISASPITTAGPSRITSRALPEPPG
jgi:hypothetical protein